MKVKHWQGYGRVELFSNGKRYDKIEDIYIQSFTIVGDHEWGIDVRNRPDIVESWILPKFNRGNYRFMVYNVKGEYDNSSSVDKMNITVKYRKIEIR